MDTDAVMLVFRRNNCRTLMLAPVDMFMLLSGSLRSLKDTVRQSVQLPAPSPYQEMPLLVRS